MTRLGIWLYRPRLILAGAFVANLVHPLIHGTPLDSGALDQCFLALNGSAMCCQEDK